MNKSDFLQLLSSYFSGEITAEQFGLLKQAIKENALYKKEYLYLKDFFRQAPPSEAALSQKFEELWSKIEDKERAVASRDAINRNAKPLYRKWIPVAAALIAALLAGAGYYRFFYGVRHKNELTIAVVNHNNFKTLLKLPDGTIVWINRNSGVSYNEDFGKEKRELQLSGEAYFDVVHNPAVPMTIHAGAIDVVVRGTAFNIKAYPQESTITTSLIRGKIEVFEHNRKGNVVVLEPNQKIIFETNRRLGMLPESDIDTAKAAAPPVYKIEKANLQNNQIAVPELAWMKDVFAFTQTPLAEVLDKLGKRYNTTIKLGDPALQKITYSGAFKDESLEQALDAICLGSNLRYKKEDKAIIIFNN